MTSNSSDASAERRLNPTTLLFVFCSGISYIGTWMQKIAVGWLAWELTHSIAWVGAMALCDLLATMATAPIAGALADRVDPRRLILWTQTAGFIQAVALCLLAGTHHLGIGALFGLALLLGLSDSANQPARLALVMRIAGSRHLANAVAANSVCFNLARSIGPAIAAFIMTGGGAERVFLINALSFLPLLVMLLGLKLGGGRQPDRAHVSLLSDTIEGFRYAATHPALGILFLLLISICVLVRPYAELAPAFAATVFHGGPRTLAVLTGAQGIGALFAGLLMVFCRQDLRRLAKLTFAGALGLSGAVLAFVATSDLTYAAPAVVVAGFCQVICNVGVQSFLQLTSAPPLRGRMIALFGLIFRGGPALGAFLMGAVSDRVGLPRTLGIAAALSVVLWLLLVQRRATVTAMAVSSGDGEPVLELTAAAPTN